MPKSSIDLANASPIPEARKTPPNIPPAPVMSTTEQIGPRAESTTFSKTVLSLEILPPSTAIETRVAISSAMGVSPNVMSNFTQPASPLITPTLDRVENPVFMKINSTGSSSNAMIVPTEGGLSGSSSSDTLPNTWEASTLTRGAMNLAHK